MKKKKKKKKKNGVKLMFMKVIFLQKEIKL